MKRSEMVNKAVLCVASYFPPDATTGAHRTRAVVRYLPAYDWRPVVVSPRIGADTIQDASLLDALPEDLVVYRTSAPNLLSWAVRLRGWIKRMLGRAAAPANPAEPAPPVGRERRGGWMDWTSWWLQIPDLMVGWLPAGLKAAQRAVGRHHCQAIYSTAPQWTAHLIALLTKRLTGLPWVADFRDPWRSSPWRKIPYPSVDRYDGWLEGRVVREADWVVCNTEPLREDFVRRFPELSSKFVTVPNGFDPEEFADLRAQRPVGGDKVVLSHAGWFYGQRRPEPTFRALRLLQEGAPPSTQVCLQLLGHPHYEGKHLKGLAAEHGVEPLVLVRGEVPHRQALELMRGSDIQLLVGFNGVGADLQVPAKLFEYFGVGKPVLALAPRRSAIADMMARSGIEGEVCDPDDPQQIAAAIRRMAARRKDCAGQPQAADAGPMTQFYRREQVARIAKLLGRPVTSTLGPSAPSLTHELEP